MWLLTKTMQEVNQPSPAPSMNLLHLALISPSKPTPTGLIFQGFSLIILLLCSSSFISLGWTCRWVLIIVLEPPFVFKFMVCLIIIFYGYLLICLFVCCSLCLQACLGCMRSPMAYTELVIQIQTQKPLQPQLPTPGTITICMEKMKMGMGIRTTTHPSLISLEWEPLERWWILGFSLEPRKTSYEQKTK